MNTQKDAASAYLLGGPVHQALKAALDDVASMPLGESRTWALRGLASMLLDKPEALRLAAIEQCPELASATPIPDTYLSAEEVEIASRLTPNQLTAVDRALVAGSISTWRTIAWVVGDALVTLDAESLAPPLGVVIQRVQLLVQEGQLQARGNTDFMRLGEVRLPPGCTGAA